MFLNKMLTKIDKHDDIDAPCNKVDDMVSTNNVGGQKAVKKVDSSTGKKKRGRKPLNIGKNVDNDTFQNFVDNQADETLIAHIPMTTDTVESESQDVLETISSANESLVTENQHLRERVAKLTKKSWSTFLPYQCTAKNISHDEDLNLVEKPIMCWYCSHHFDGEKYYLPEACMGQTYNVSGCFCSPNCALSYNLLSKDSNVSARTILLNALYRQNLENGIPGAIIPAPDKYLLEGFGGDMTLEEFRLQSNVQYLTNNEFSIVGVNKIVKERSSSLHECKGKGKSDLVLKRSKPLKNCHTSMRDTFGLVEKTS